MDTIEPLQAWFLQARSRAQLDPLGNYLWRSYLPQSKTISTASQMTFVNSCRCEMLLEFLRMLFTHKQHEAEEEKGTEDPAKALEEPFCISKTVSPLFSCFISPSQSLTIFKTYILFVRNKLSSHAMNLPRTMSLFPLLQSTISYPEVIIKALAWFSLSCAAGIAARWS